MEFTGERVIPKKMKATDPLLLEHAARYYFATTYAKGRVLDIACGSGFGTHLVAKSCKSIVDEVIGVDIDSEAVRYAMQNYYHPQSRFMEFDALASDLPEEIGSFDTILCFETIEHISDDRKFMKVLFTLLRPGGTLLLSTPFGNGRGQPCNYPFHVQQLTQAEFVDLFSPYPFAEVQIYYQKGVLIEPPRSGMRYPLGVAVCRK